MSLRTLVRKRSQNLKKKEGSVLTIVAEFADSDKERYQEIKDAIVETQQEMIAAGDEKLTFGETVAHVLECALFEEVEEEKSKE